jgi:hypothetical protein
MTVEERLRAKAREQYEDVERGELVVPAGARVRFDARGGGAWVQAVVHLTASQVGLALEDEEREVAERRRQR